jgi:tripartite-type tricarboxylate transporter receptor subunit TctC
MKTSCNRRITRRLALTLCFASIPAAATAQGSYPNRVIKVIVPFPAGTAVDVVTRIVADKLTNRWGQAIIIENRLGATGNIGAEMAAKADPDGYTLLASAPPPLAINQSLYPNLNFDPAMFVPVSLMVEVPNVLIVNSGVPANTLQELIALSKSRPSELTYGSTGPGGTPRLTMEMLKLNSGAQLRDIPTAAAWRPH